MAAEDCPLPACKARHPMSRLLDPAAPLHVPLLANNNEFQVQEHLAQHAIQDAGQSFLDKQGPHLFMV